MNTQRLPPDPKDLWSQFQVAEEDNKRRDIMAEVIKSLPLNSSKKDAVDVALVECTVRPILFELGMGIAMEASEYVREAFRRQLVENGAVFQLMRLVRTMDCPLSRDEVVMFGNRYTGGLLHDEINQFLGVAEKIEGITLLDLRRLKKQLESKAA